MILPKKKISIVIPVYHNERNLASTIPALLALSVRLPEYQLELVFVDDGSKDASRKLLRNAAQENPGMIKAILLTRNFGQTAAIQAGLRHATGDCIGIISCDLQEPHEKFIDMVTVWAQGSLFVIGERISRAEAKSHQATSSFYWRLVRRFAFSDFPPIGYDFCLLDRQIVNDVNKINEKNSSIFVLIYWLGYVPHRIPICREIRRAGHSQWRFRKKVTFTIDTLIAFTHLPARLITITGLSSALMCIGYLLVVVCQWYWLHAAPPGWATLAGLVLLIGAMILFSLGIISEYLLRILDETRRRPPFVVESITPGPTIAAMIDSEILPQNGQTKDFRLL